MDAATAAEASVGWFEQIGNFFKSSSYEVLELIVIIVFGLGIIKILMRLTKQGLLASSIDRSLIAFVSAIVNFVLVFVLVIYCLSRMHVNVTGLVALVSAMGLAIGLALQDLVGGIANGLVIINTKPFNVDDYVTIGNQSGTVREISLLHTVLVTVDNKKVILTNKAVYNSEITNFTAFPNRRLDLSYNIDYSASFRQAKEIIGGLIRNHPLVLKTPEPFVRLTGENENSLTITARVWVKSENFWDVNFDLKESIREAFVAAGMKAPYNQLTVGFRDDAKPAVAFEDQEMEV